MTTLLLALLCIQDDPAPITQGITSWYRVERKESGEWTHRGYACEKLIPVGGKPWAFDYSYELMFIMPEGETKLSAGKYGLTAQLDQNCEAMTIDGALQVVDGDTRSFKLKTLAETRVLEIQSGDRLLRISKSLDDPATPVQSLMLYSAWRTKNLADKASLRYIDPWSKDGLVAIEAAVSKPEKRPMLDRQVTLIHVELKSMTALFPDLPAYTNLWIDRYGRIVEAVTAAETDRLTLVANEEEALRGDKMLKAFNSDPFKKRRAATPETVIDRVLPAKVRVVDPAQSLARAQALLKMLSEDVMAGRDGDSARHYEEFVSIYREVWSKLDDVKRATLDRMRLDAERSYGGVKRLVRQATALSESIGEYVDALAIRDAQARFDLLKAIPDRPEFWRQAERDEVVKLVAAGAAALDRGHAMITLNAKKLILTGTAITNDPRNTYAVINDKNLRVGDVVDGVKIESIARDSVVVSFGGVKRDLLLAK